MRISRNSEGWASASCRGTLSEERSAYARVLSSRGAKLGPRRVAMNRRKVPKGDARGRSTVTPLPYLFISLLFFLHDTPYQKLDMLYESLGNNVPIRSLARCSGDKWRGGTFTVSSRDGKRVLFFLNHSGRKVNLSICGIARTSPDNTAALYFRSIAWQDVRRYFWCPRNGQVNLPCSRSSKNTLGTSRPFHPP